MLSRKQSIRLFGAAEGSIIQIKIRLLGISPMIRRRVLVLASCTLHELHGVIQVAMGWEGLHLFQFKVRAVADYIRLYRKMIDAHGLSFVTASSTIARSRTKARRIGI